MKTREVVSLNDKKEFIKLPKKLYKNDSNWICPLDVDIENIFNQEANGNFKHGRATRWLLFDDKDQIIGRIAAFIDDNKVNLHKYKTGGCGFFECVDNQDAANVLFDTAKAWLEGQQMEAMEGPVNFGENFIHWGLLVDGFMPQGYGMPYNPPYYQKLFENYGFKNYFEQYSFHKPLSEGWPEKLVRLAELTSKRAGYSFETLDYNNLDKYVGDFVTVYNTIWSAYHSSYTPMGDKEIKQMLLDFKAIVDPDLISFAYYYEQPVGILLSIPDVNQLLAKLKNGKLNLVNKLKFMYYRKKVITRNRALLAGIHPDYQNSGVALALFYQLAKTLRDKPKQKEIELSWVADYNPKMIGIYNKIGAKKMKTHITYMYQFNRDLPFERFTNEFEGKKF